MGLNHLAAVSGSRVPPFVATQPGLSHDGAPPKNSAQTLGFYLLLAYLFAVFSLLTEVSTELFGFKPYVTIVVGPLAILMTVLSGQALAILRTRIGAFTILFLVWILMAAPFTSYRSGTFDELKNIFLRTYSIVFMCGAMVITIQDCKKLVHTLVMAGMVVFVVSWFYGEVGFDGRWSMSFGSLMNANDLATHLLMIMPFCIATAAISSSKLIRIAAIVISLLIFFALLKTASRGGLVSLVMMVAALLWSANAFQKIVALFAVTIVLLASVIVLPGDIWKRYATIFSDDDVSYGVGSREQRKELLHRSFKTTITHPVFGVGPGVFMVYDAQGSEEQGQRPYWVGSHNSYTQISAEAGIPAFIFFLGAIISAIRTCSQLYKRARPIAQFKEIATIAEFLLVGWVGLATNIFFAHIAYRYHVPTMLGITIAFSLAAERLLAAAPLVPAASPAHAHAFAQGRAVRSPHRNKPGS